jgi:hypothetical protein
MAPPGRERPGAQCRLRHGCRCGEGHWLVDIGVIADQSIRASRTCHQPDRTPEHPWTSGKPPRLSLTRNTRETGCTHGHSSRNTIRISPRHRRAPRASHSRCGQQSLAAWRARRVHGCRYIFRHFWVADHHTYRGGSRFPSLLVAGVLESQNPSAHARLSGHVGRNDGCSRICAASVTLQQSCRSGRMANRVLEQLLLVPVVELLCSHRH